METRTPGSASGPQKRTGGNPDTALRADSTNHHDIAIVDTDGRLLAKRRIPEAGSFAATSCSASNP
ncbi:MAG: hypothetical protein ACLP3C_03570 [Mycobacterium sp.]|uniref:hypothetical protein n=1 Tax=Mycobacterium sp. TaxID=1785 RepID=UPI003F945ECE